MGEFSVQISADLVKQLGNNGEVRRKKTKKVKPGDGPKVVKKHAFDDSEAHKPTSPGWPIQHPLFVPVTPPAPPANAAELEAIRSVVQESDKVLEKLQKQERDMIQEVTERARDLHDKEFRLPYQKPMPCLADYDACRACYKDYTNHILKCAPLAKTYYECVRKAKHQPNSTHK